MKQFFNLKFAFPSKRTFTALLFALACPLILSGCLRDDLVLWSPDGKQVALLGPDGVRLGDETGTLSQPIWPDTEIFRFLPDNQHALITTQKEAKCWTDLTEALPDKERLEVLSLSESIWMSGSVDEVKDDALAPAAMLDLYDRYGADLVKTKLASSLSHCHIPSCYIYSLQKVDVSARKPAGKPLWRTSQDIQDVRISPKGTMAALTVDHKFGSKIVVVPLGGADARTVAESYANPPEWSCDGRFLLYIHEPPYPQSSQPEDLSNNQHPWIATLDRREVADSDGKLLNEFPAAQEMMELIAHGSSRVRCLPDGSIILSAKRRKFPSLKKSEPENCFVKLTPDMRSFETIVPADEVPGGRLDNFEPNQDGTRVVVGGTNGEIAVLDLETRNVSVLEKTTQRLLAFAPQWRKKDELCYPSRSGEKPAAGGSLKIVLLSLSDPKQRVVLSKDWPAHWADRYLQRPSHSYISAFSPHILAAPDAKKNTELKPETSVNDEKKKKHE